MLNGLMHEVTIGLCTVNCWTVGSVSVFLGSCSLEKVFGSDVCSAKRSLLFPSFGSIADRLVVLPSNADKRRAICAAVRRAAYQLTTLAFHHSVFSLSIRNIGCCDYHSTA
jgi:hypothetical protein